MKENKLPSPLERIKFNTIMKDAEEMVIREGDYQIGKLHILLAIVMFLLPNSVLYL